MANSWRPDERSGGSLHIPANLVPFLALLGIGIALRLVFVESEARSLQREVTSLRVAANVSANRQRDLEVTVAQQHQQLQASEGELETLRLQIEAVEMQLDGVDTLSRQLRAQVGLPPDEGTWANNAGATTGQGGAYAPARPSRERLSLVQQRLANGLAELYGLQAYVQSRAAAGGDGAGTAGGVQQPEAKVVDPVNWPARGDVTSDFGWRFFRDHENFHTGIDVAMPIGTPVVATAEGTVIGSGWQPGYGWCVLLQHGDGFNTLYAHLAELWVKLGDTVQQGRTLGLSGSSGNSTGPHLHYEVWRDGQPQDPRPYMDGQGPR